MGFVVGKVAMGQVSFSQYFRFPTVGTLPLVLRTRSFIYHRRQVTRAVNNVFQ